MPEIYKTNKEILIRRKLTLFLPRSSLLTLFKSFVRPQLNYGDLVYDQADTSLFTSKIKALTITRALNSSLIEKLYQELGLESLEMHRCYRVYYELC